MKGFAWNFYQKCVSGQDKPTDYDTEPDYNPNPDFFQKICVSGQRTIHSFSAGNEFRRQNLTSIDVRI